MGLFPQEQKLEEPEKMVSYQDENSQDEKMG